MNDDGERLVEVIEVEDSNDSTVELNPQQDANIGLFSSDEEDDDFDYQKRKIPRLDQDAESSKMQKEADEKEEEVE